MGDHQTDSNQENSSNASRKSRPIIVGIGASAGGLDALGRLVSRIPENSKMAFVIIQHLDPTHESALSELLGRKTSLRVREVENDEPVLADHVYVIPPNRYLTICDGVLKLEEPEVPRGSRMAINHFFRSLAADAEERAIGIILSGTGSDGTSGLKDIKEVGGLVIAQEPEEASHAGMPASAIQTGLTDLVLSVDAMVERLLQYVERSFRHASLSEEALNDKERDHLMPIFQLLRQKADLDFRRYRKKTVLRRIQRRMGLAHVDSLSDYLKLLRESDTEAKALGRDILINVTDFFRDAEAWKTIEEEVVDGLLDRASQEHPLRAWVAGCATGEEAYSLAMLLSEKTEHMSDPPRIQIFATDIAENALATAREGVYPKSLVSNVSEERLRNYFETEGEKYRVKRRIRELVTFAPHNVLTQPPFSNLDFVSCRNLLIYFEPEVQRHLFEVFHFSLVEGGCLFLGSSESVGRSNLQFSTISKNWRIYRRTGTKTKMPYQLDGRVPLPVSDTNYSSQRPVRTESITERVYEQFLEGSGAAIALVNPDNRVSVLQGAGDNYFRFPGGELSAQLPDLLEICRDSIRTKVRSCLFRARQNRKSLTMEGRLEGPKEKQGFRVTARPFHQADHQEEIFLVSFEIVRVESLKLLDDVGDDQSNAAVIIKDLEHELASTREQLNCTIEEFETANEELKASHEEAMSMNEELQSSNEELETSKEELQSLNEELSTLNHQLEGKIEELQATTDDLDNLLSSTNIATLFLDTRFRLRRFTPRARSFFKLREADIGRPFSDISSIVEDPDLVTEAEEVLSELKPIERKVGVPGGVTLMRRISAYRTADNRIEGVVVTLDDITSVEVVSQRLERRERQQAAVASLGKRALSEPGIHELMQETTRVCRDVLDVDLTKVLELNEDSSSLLLVAGVGWKSGLLGKYQLEAEDYSQAGFTLKIKSPVVMKDIATEKRFSGPKLLHDHGVVSGASVLIGERENVYGVLGVHSKRRVDFTEDDLNFLQGVANILAEAIYRRNDRKSLKESEFRFRTMADNIAQLAWAADANGYIYWYNKRWYEYTGTTLKEMKGWGWTSVQHPDHVERVKEKFKRHVESGEFWEDTFPLLSKGGEYRSFLSRAAPIRDENGDLVMWFGTNTDIEDRKRAEEGLRRADELKDQFLATLAHELRNPLAPVKMGIGLLKNQDLPTSERDDCYGMLGRQTDYLVRLVDDLMDVSRISRGKVNLQREIVSIKWIVNAAIETVKPQVEEGGHRVEISQPESETYVDGDKTRLTQVVANLLSNAARYSEEPGLIKVEVETNDDSVSLSVTDEGIGIRKEMLGNVFELFSQAESDGRKTQAGLGIGLTLVKSLVELHGGSIEARSEGTGKGSQFVMSLPTVSPKEAEVAEEPQRDVSYSSDAKKKILIVDDNESAANMVGKLLSYLGHEVKTAYLAREALEVGEAFGPDIVLMDIGMPEMDGLEAAKRMRQTEWGTRALLAATTGWGQNKDRELTAEAGYDIHLVKPIDQAALNSVLEKL